MRVKSFIRSQKSNVSSTAWSQEKLKSKDFSISNHKGGVYPLTRAWRWKVRTLEATGRKFKLLTAYHTKVPEFQAVVAESLGEVSRVFASLEFHQSHPGWHLHSTCDIIELVSVGVSRPREFIRLPSAQKPHRCIKLTDGILTMSDDLADAIVADFFNVSVEKGLFGTIGIPW
jgi:hypothetical protein